LIQGNCGSINQSTPADSTRKTAICTIFGHTIFGKNRGVGECWKAGIPDSTCSPYHPPRHPRFQRILNRNHDLSEIPVGKRSRTGMAEQKATNVTWHAHKITREDRQKLSGHRGAVLWFTGLVAFTRSSSMATTSAWG
jgi:hypothetical protein